MKKIGILHGQENTFPEAVVARINAKNVPGIKAEPVLIDKVIQGKASGYAVIIDRISQDVPFYRAYLKNAALQGTAVINNPFWWSADEKFFNNCLAIQVGVPVPKTVLLPSNQMPPDTTPASFRNLDYPMDWDGIVSEIGFPAYMKPHAGGGWKSVYRVENLDDLFAKHNETDTLVMMLQEEIVFEEYYRCYCIGRKHVRIMPYEPRNPHHLRYVTDRKPSEHMLALLTDYVLRLNNALGYDFNTVEFAVRDGIPYAIDFCNPAPDADINSVGAENFEWVVETAANYAIERALAQQDGKDNLTWGTYLRSAAAGMGEFKMESAVVSTPAKTSRRKTEKTGNATPGRRGRKPKAVAAESADSTPKKRGPKPKAAATTPAEPKKRGPKPKPKAEVSAEPKKRGRKPKALSANQAPVEAAAPKRRGRPAKSPVEATTDAAPKRRGRPAKTADSTPKPAGKRGRKPKSAITGSAPKPVEKGKRGRKPKAKAEKAVRQKREKITKPFGELIGLEAVLAAEKMMGKDPS